MRILAALFLSAALAACATPPPAPAIPAPSAETSAPAPDPRIGRLAAFLSAAGGAEAPTREAVERALGPPDIARQEGAGAILTYRLESCALVLAFAADARNALRLAETHPGPRRAGVAAPGVQQCAAEALARGARGVS